MFVVETMTHDTEIRPWLLLLSFRAYGPALEQLEALRSGWGALTPDARRMVVGWWLASEFRAGLLPWGQLRDEGDS